MFSVKLNNRFVQLTSNVTVNSFHEMSQKLNLPGTFNWQPLWVTHILGDVQKPTYGGGLTLTRVLMSKPASSNSCATWRCPLRAARWSGECLSMLWQGSVGCRRSNCCAVSRRPYWQARSRGDSLWWLRMFGFAWYYARETATNYFTIRPQLFILRSAVYQLFKNM